jgi:Flp pilus assembly protein TadG
MLRRFIPPPRRAGVLIEAALVLPIAFLLVLGVLIGGMGVFRYQEVAHLARLTARYAAVHGGRYAQENAAAISAGTLPNVNESYLGQNIAAANAVLLNASHLSVSVTIATHSGAYDWDDTTDNHNRMPYSTYTDSNNNTDYVTNTVQVTVSYQWIPEWFLAGPITLTSTSVVPMSY